MSSATYSTAPSASTECRSIRVIRSTPASVQLLHRRPFLCRRWTCRSSSADSAPSVSSRPRAVFWRGQIAHLEVLCRKIYHSVVNLGPHENENAAALERKRTKILALSSHELAHLDKCKSLVLTPIGTELLRRRTQAKSENYNCLEFWPFVSREQTQECAELGPNRE